MHCFIKKKIRIADHSTLFQTIPKFLTVIVSVKCEIKIIFKTRGNHSEGLEFHLIHLILTFVCLRGFYMVHFLAQE
jgi:hypothetical protein